MVAGERIGALDGTENNAIGTKRQGRPLGQFDAKKRGKGGANCVRHQEMLREKMQLINVQGADTGMIVPIVL